MSSTEINPKIPSTRKSNAEVNDGEYKEVWGKTRKRNRRHNTKAEGDIVVTLIPG